MRQKIGVGRRTTLIWSRRGWGLSIEMNAKIESFSGDLIEFRNVSYHINDIPGRAVISGVSLAVPHGETLVILRRCDSGKTTLLRLINALYLQSQDEALVERRPIGEWDANGQPRCMG